MRPPFKPGHLARGGSLDFKPRPTAKLNPGIVEKIRASSLPDSHWARVLSVCTTTIQKARSGKTWR